MRHILINMTFSGIIGYAVASLAGPGVMHCWQTWIILVSICVLMINMAFYMKLK